MSVNNTEDSAHEGAQVQPQTSAFLVPPNEVSAISIREITGRRQTFRLGAKGLSSESAEDEGELVMLLSVDNLKPPPEKSNIAKSA